MDEGTNLEKEKETGLKSINIQFRTDRSLVGKTFLRKLETVE
jgi:hypothetical protein